MEQNEERCENCRYFELIDAEMEVGHCVRYAPQTSRQPERRNVLRNVAPCNAGSPLRRVRGKMS